MSGAAGDNFVNELYGEDTLGIIVRTAIRLEAQVIRYIAMKASAPHELPGKLDFEIRLSFALALGFDARFKSALKSISNTRNNFAHSIDASLNKGDVNNFYKCLSPAEKENYQRIFSMTDTKAATDLDRFRIMVIALYLNLDDWVSGQQPQQPTVFDQ